MNLHYVLILNTRDVFATVHSRVDSYDDSTINFTSSKLTKNEVSLKISNIAAYTVYTWWKSNLKRILLFLRRKYEKLFILYSS